MPVTKNNIKNVSRTTNTALVWIVITWCIVVIVLSTLLLILGNTALKDKFKPNPKSNKEGFMSAPGTSNNKNNNSKLIDNTLSKITLQNYNIIMGVILAFHIIVAFLINAKY